MFTMLSPYYLLDIINTLRRVNPLEFTIPEQMSLVTFWVKYLFV